VGGVTQAAKLVTVEYLRRRIVCSLYNSLHGIQLALNIKDDTDQLAASLCGVNQYTQKHMDKCHSFRYRVISTAIHDCHVAVEMTR